MDSPVTNSVWIGIHHAHARPVVDPQSSLEGMGLTSKERSKGSKSEIFSSGEVKNKPQLFDLGILRDSFSLAFFLSLKSTDGDCDLLLQIFLR